MPHHKYWKINWNYDFSPFKRFLVDKLDIGKWRRKKNVVKSDGYVYLHCKKTFLFFIWLLQALFEQLYKPNYLLMSIARGFNGSVNIFRKLWLSIIISPIIHNFSAFFLKYFFVGIYILNKIIQNKQICKFIDCWIIDQNTFDFK